MTQDAFHNGFGVETLCRN